MPVIAVANTKGGSGKTTTVLLLATELERRGYDVTIMDCDPKQWASRIGDSPNLSSKIRVIPNVMYEDIATIAKRERKDRFVIMDLEGTKNLGFDEAARVANLFLTPVLDYDECSSASAIETFDMLSEIETETGRSIPFRVFHTRTNLVNITKDEQTAMNLVLDETGCQRIKTRIGARAAITKVGKYGVGVHRLPKSVGSKDGAEANVRMFVQEVMKVMRAEIEKRKAARAAAQQNDKAEVLA